MSMPSWNPHTGEWTTWGREQSGGNPAVPPLEWLTFARGRSSGLPCRRRSWEIVGKHRKRKAQEPGSLQGHRSVEIQ